MAMKMTVAARSGQSSNAADATSLVVDPVFVGLLDTGADTFVTCTVTPAAVEIAVDKAAGLLIAVVSVFCTAATDPAPDVGAPGGIVMT